MAIKTCHRVDNKVRHGRHSILLGFNGLLVLDYDFVRFSIMFDCGGRLSRICRVLVTMSLVSIRRPNAIDIDIDALIFFKESI